MTNLKVISGAGFYAGIAFMNELKNLCSQKAFKQDSDFPNLTVEFKNDLNVDLNGSCSEVSNLKENELLLCFSATKSYEKDPRYLSLLNPHWYRSAGDGPKYLLASAYSLKSKKFNFLTNLIQPTPKEEAFLAKTIELLCLELPSELFILEFCEFLKEIRLKYDCEFVLACTEFLILKSHIKQYPFVDPVENIIKEIYFESIS